ncbi:hypothetical protein [Bacteroides sp. Ga6A1]|uniref:hypothetical protein n=1 Tax=Bacteroides sp. Ga6A1 TaxID=1410607 RepID=UPI0004E1E297|nr:hypothetical protein [Bacteroides sp. Ga6A1]
MLDKIEYVKPELYTIEMNDIVLAGASAFDNTGGDPIDSGDFNSKGRGGNGGGMWKYMDDEK